MMNNSIKNEDLLFDLNTSVSEVIQLESKHFQQAAEIRETVVGETNQWQTYINALALIGFEEWLEERKPELQINRDKCSILQPEYASLINAVCNLKVSDLNFCLIATCEPLDEIVAIPRAAIELPEFAAHFYVLIEVLEEQEQIIIRGFLRYDQLVNYQERENLDTQKNWSYQLPLSLFNPELSYLLIYSRFVKSTAISLPLVPAINQDTASLTQAELEELLSKLQSPREKLWQYLTWEQGSMLLRSPELINLLYQWQTQTKKVIPLAIRIKEVFALLTQKAVNTAQWLQSEMDEMAQELELFFRPNFNPAMSRCRSIDKFEQAIGRLRNGGMGIPDDIIPTYQDFELSSMSLRLCAVNWSALNTSKQNHKWSLLLILGNQFGNTLPAGIKLQVSNVKGILEEPVLDISEQFIYAIVEGDWGDKFVLTIVPPNGTPLTLNPYTFELAPSL